MIFDEKTIEAIKLNVKTSKCTLVPVDDPETKRKLAEAMARVSNNLAKYKNMDTGLLPPDPNIRFK